MSLVKTGTSPHSAVARSPPGRIYHDTFITTSFSRVIYRRGEIWKLICALISSPGKWQVPFYSRSMPISLTTVAYRRGTGFCLLLCKTISNGAITDLSSDPKRHSVDNACGVWRVVRIIDNALTSTGGPAPVMSSKPLSVLVILMSFCPAAL